MKIEAAPFIGTNLSIKAKEELYALPFEFDRVANRHGKRPENNLGFLESDEAYHKRLKEWMDEEKKVLFDGWVCKNMQFYQEIYNEEKKIFITFETNEYAVRYLRKEFLFPSLPETIDEFITDLKRIGIALFWKQELVKHYSVEALTPEINKKVIDYYGIIKKAQEKHNGSST